MNLNKRLKFANAATVIIPVIITALLVLAYLFIYSKVSNTNLSFDNYQRLNQITLELSRPESYLQKNPEIIEEKSFQSYLEERIAGLDGELVILKDERLVFSTRPFSKIEIAKVLGIGKMEQSKEPVILDRVSYTIQTVEVDLKNGSEGLVILLAPLEKGIAGFMGILILAGLSFGLSFTFMNIFISRQFSLTILKPLNNLQKAAAEISGGNLNYEIVEEGDEEIQELCRDLELMRIKLKNAVNEQLKLEDNRKVLISSISHDLKTPVTSIKGYVEGILDGVANSPEKTDRYLKTIYTKAQQVDEMIDDLLLYAKLDLNQIPFNFEKTEVEEYIKKCILESEPELDRHRIKIMLVNDLKGNHHVLLDQERMNRVIMNILDNSLKYMDKDQGEIRIFLRETKTSIIIEIRDNGIGIKEKDLPYIFDRFYRSDTARGEIKGSGLGLAIARQIIEGHGGKVWALTHGDQGTSIMISLSKS
ncbi:MAG: hypothetical protein APF84_11600 [Gracilibacter sp. BRH_c7a]|nr:MAG: hypothetical protein APF84_11600 [Gracilibacter sp. BRH_c7a]